MAIDIKTEKFQFPGFRKGYYQLKYQDVKVVKNRIKEILEIKQDVSFHAYLYGRLEPTVSKAQAIEQIFSEYSINNIWGLPEIATVENEN